ncbi:hypothetical protein [Streptomyces sp. NBC_00572]|uniref:hypothetical protein n=1 Tax=Streptomyces sp. NBC_00572 TaxID=2903664 RepID=UPI0022566C45|nr:hypothetical protein [Streptomyces sp. NBC_00572]MCX4984201.1 hypothetical protein [Streptomyces sp. NBC_00572]
MTKDQTGRLVGAAFGLVFIQANAGVLPTAVAAPLRLLAVAAFLGVVVLGRRGRAAPRTTGTGTDIATGTGFGRRYWYVVAAEVLALTAGLLVINRVLHTPRASVGWIAFVVGVHFFGLAAAWRRPSLNTLAVSLTACGFGGLILAALDAPAAVIGAVAGVLPGALLLAAVWWSGRPITAAPAEA